MESKYGAVIGSVIGALWWPRELMSAWTKPTDERRAAAVAKAVDGLRAMIEKLPVGPDYPEVMHTLQANVRGIVERERLTLRHWPTLAELARTYERRCREAGLEPWALPL